jgi:DNA repair protein SbcD/Mre11
MRLVHLADLHLGYRQYQRLTSTGINQREADVARAFQRAIDRIIELRPDIVLVAGDVFHSVRPTNPAIVHGFKQFSRLRQALPDAVIVVVAGNHDTPRAAETGGILGLFSELGIEIAATAARRIRFPERDLEVLAVPDVPGDRPAYAPNPDMKHNILVMHGEVEGVLPQHGWCPERKAMEIPLAELGPDRWSYVALGHYHVYRRVADRAYYSGSLEYASTNVWGELAEERAQRLAGKGFVEHDLLTGEHTFHVIEPARSVVDLPPVQARGMTAPELDFAIRETVEACDGGIDGRIVRLMVCDVPRHIARALDHRTLREYRRRALHFHLDVRRPEVVRTQSVSGAPGRRASLAEVVRDSLRSRHIDRDIDREELVGLGLRYLRDAEAAESHPLVEQESE